MSGDPKLSMTTKLRLATFAGEMAATNPSQARTIFSLQETLEQRLPMALQNEITLKLNKDAKGTLAEAAKIIEKDPKILDEVNRDPTKLATIMGIKTATPALAPVPSAPKPAADAGTSSPSAASKAEPPRAKLEPVAVAAASAAPKAVAPISETELHIRSEIAAESARVTKMPGFEEFAARAEKSQSLGQAADAMMGKKTGSSREALAALKDIQKDPEFFNKANKGIDEIPEQMREGIFTHIANDPGGAELGRKALAGEAGAKSSLFMKGFSLDSFTGGKGLEGLFSGDGMKNMMQMLTSILPMMMDMLKGGFEKLTGGLGKFSQSPDLLRMGNNPEGTRNLSQGLQRLLGVDTSGQRVVDATKPNEPALPVAQLGSDGPKLTVQGANQPAANEPPEIRKPSGGFSPSGT